MTNFTYYDNIPNAPNDPSQDQPKMEVNTNSTDLILAEDHVSFNLNNGGWHKLIHMIPQAKSIVANTAAGQFYTSTSTTNFGTDNQLWYKSTSTAAGSPGEQITGNNAAANNGWAFFSGIIVQWGSASVAAGIAGQDVAFTPNFPNNAFVVNITPQTVTAAGQSYQANIVDKTKFHITQFNNSNATKNFYWVAIGN